MTSEETDNFEEEKKRNNKRASQRDRKSKKDELSAVMNFMSDGME